MTRVTERIDEVEKIGDADWRTRGIKESSIRKNPHSINKYQSRHFLSHL